MSLVAKYNFLRWYDTTPVTAFPDELPHAYWFDRERCPYAPIGLPGEVLSFYTNTENGLLISGAFSDLRLALVKASTGAVVNASVGTLIQHMAGVSAYNMYANVTIPVVPAGMYYFKIYKFTGGAEVLRSTFIEVKTNVTEVYNTTTYCKFRHDRFWYNIRYADLPNFYQQFRLHINVRDEQTSTESEPYTSVTNGQTRVVKSVLRQHSEVETYYMDKEAHRAAAIMAEHSYLEMNGKMYSKKSDYKRENNPRSKRSKGSFEVWDDEFTAVNRC